MPLPFESAPCDSHCGQEGHEAGGHFATPALAAGARHPASGPSLAPRLQPCSPRLCPHGGGLVGAPAPGTQPPFLPPHLCYWGAGGRCRRPPPKLRKPPTHLHSVI